MSTTRRESLAGSAPKTTLRFRFFNRVVNPVMRFVLRSRVGGRLGRAVALLTYRGPVSGRQITFPVEYALDAEGRYLVVPGHHEQKRWWRNFGRERRVELLVAGQEVIGDARLLDDPRQIEQALATYFRRFPAGARVAKVRLRPDGTPDPAELADAARACVILRITPA